MKKQRSIEPVTQDHLGKVPPQAIELEQAVLGALMVESDAYLEVAQLLDAHSFYKSEHQAIFAVIKQLATKNKPIDLLVVVQELISQGTLDDVGGPAYIAELTSKVGSAAHIGYHAQIIAQKYMQRELIRISSEVQAKAFDNMVDVEDVISEAENSLVAVRSTGQNNEFTTSDAITQLNQRIASNLTNKGLSGIGTGLQKFDTFSGGMQKTDLIIVAGESSQGKTSLALTVLKNAALRYGARAAIYSLEMDKVQLVARIVAQETGISAKRILNQKLSFDEVNHLEKTTSALAGLPLYFDESSTSTIDQICTSIRRLKMKRDINLAVVDYLQLVGTGSAMKNKTDEAQLAEITRRLKNTAKDLGITIIALSQLSRTTTSNHRPTKSRLRGSGQIEEAADVVLMIWRPDTYSIDEFSEPHEGIGTAGLAECIVAKGRNIGTGSFLLRFNEETTAFFDYDPFEASPEYNSIDWPVINPNEHFEPLKF
ncbi:MAG: replicative DNA helicase [Tenuifilaceae bacterium]|jgi:replicative DNA helicase|nr:replicative DNA helicase [Tenuifilaceae bacterium]